MSTLTHEAAPVNQDSLAWVNDSPDNDLGSYPGEGWDHEDGPAPSWDAEPSDPEPIAEAYQLGYELGFAGEYPKTPGHYSQREAYWFGCGRLAGFIASPDGQAWYRDMETLEDRPAAQDEVVRAVGAVEARKAVGL